MQKMVSSSAVPYFSCVGIETLYGSIATDVVQNTRAISMSRNQKSARGIHTHRGYSRVLQATIFPLVIQGVYGDVYSQIPETYRLVLQNIIILGSSHVT